MLLFDDVAIHYILSGAQWVQLLFSVSLHRLQPAHVTVTDGLSGYRSADGLAICKKSPESQYVMWPACIYTDWCINSLFFSCGCDLNPSVYTVPFLEQCRWWSGVISSWRGSARSCVLWEASSARWWWVHPNVATLIPVLAWCFWSWSRQTLREITGACLHSPMSCSHHRVPM